MGTLWAQLLIQFYTDLFETLHMFSPWSEDCMWFGYNPCINFCHIFHFVIFWPQILWKFIDSGYLVSATLHERNSSYNFISTVLKFCTCFLHGLEMCMWFWYSPWINFCYLFHFVIFSPQILWKCIDNRYLVSATPYTISYLALCNFAHLFYSVWRCACGLDLILELIFVTFPLC